MPRTYTPGGKGHRILARLHEGPAPRAELRDVADPRATGRARHRLNRIVTALREDGLAARDAAAAWLITDAGAAALKALRAGQPVTFHAPPQWRDSAWRPEG